MVFEASEQELAAVRYSSVNKTTARYSPTGLTAALLVSNECDVAGRIFSDVRGRAHRYDGVGRILETIQRDGQWQGFTYGANGLLESESTPHLGQRRFDYNPDGQLVAVTDADGVTLIGYDQRGRRRLETRPDGAAIEYEWNTLDLLEAVHTTRGGHVSIRRVSWRGGAKPTRIGDGLGDDVFGWTGTPGVHLGFRGELTVDGLVLMGKRVYDPGTRLCLSPHKMQS